MSDDFDGMTDEPVRAEATRLLRACAEDYIGVCFAVRDMPAHAAGLRQAARDMVSAMDKFARIIRAISADAEPWQRDAVPAETRLALALADFLDRHEDTPDRERATVAWVEAQVPPGATLHVGPIRLSKAADGTVSTAYLVPQED
jgi:hypothetical protein